MELMDQCGDSALLSPENPNGSDDRSTKLKMWLSRLK
jgi:hypothetical protein